MFTVGAEHANLPPAQVGNVVDDLGFSGLFSEISRNWPAVLAEASQAHLRLSLPAACSATWAPAQPAQEPGASAFARGKQELQLRGPEPCQTL